MSMRKLKPKTDRIYLAKKWLQYAIQSTLDKILSKNPNLFD